ncbi:MAG: xanthan lyase [Bacteroidales bacterium]|nr:xanthan lyase [Bacteroidales bacterium]
MKSFCRLALILCLAAFPAAGLHAQMSPGKPKPVLRDAGYDGKPKSSQFRNKDLKGPVLVKRGISAPSGLDGRHIAMWQSHGMYYKIAENKWKWQRPSIFQTTEDLFTQSFVVPFLVPMLENAGANVLLPRERDWHRTELIMDNDPHEDISTRLHGWVVSEKPWKKSGSGFADKNSVYVDKENPFEMGTSLKATSIKKGREAKVSWIGNIPQHDEYAVYTSYIASPKNTTDARYTVYTAGGPVEISVNQRMGGSCWIYLGTFEFAPGEQELVSLSNISKLEGATISADAVKIGGGLGNIARSHKDSLSSVTSGMPRFAEGARYFMQWSGIPEKVWNQNKFEDDYRDDLMSRGEWVQYLSGKSWVYPNAKKGLNIPIDFSFALHTDAGVRPDASLIGTLGIWTLRNSNRSTKLPNGRSRQTSKELTEMILSQIDNDFGKQWDSLWVIRDIWNKSYSESRTTGTPAMLLELLSHQNFEDMKFGLDPMFRFCASRAIYKGMLKYLAMRYGRNYVVQPLPVQAFSAKLGPVKDNSAMVRLRWQERKDTLEPTAVPTRFIVYTRMDGRGWDKGQEVKAELRYGYYTFEVPVQAGHIYSYKVVAANDGGNSFPSEILSVGLPQLNTMGRVTIVNAFHRISGPKWHDDNLMAGFDNNLDSGVPYLRDWAFVGKQFEYNRNLVYKGGEDIAFGSCHEDYADVVIGGNSFDYPYIHGKSIMAAGYAFDSCSSLAISMDYELSADSFAVDIIGGKECRVQTGSRSPVRGGLWTEDLTKAVNYAISNGKSILISGSYIASDAYDAGLESFVRSKLGFTLRREQGSHIGSVSRISGGGPQINFPTEPVEGSYCVESPDALSAFGLGSQIWMRYNDSGMAAGVRIEFGSYRVAAFGFPLEIIEEESRDYIMRETLKYF